MFALFKKKGSSLSLRITGMHCTSCSLSIDNAIEDLEGVYSSTTNYAKSVSHIQYNNSLVTAEEIISTISNLGYEAGLID